MVQINIILMDLDGTIYRGQELLPGALETVKYIRSKQIQLYFFTNNSEKNREQIAEKLNDLGINCRVDSIISAGYACAYYLKSNHCKNVFVSGTDALRKELQTCDIDLVDWDVAETLVIGMDYSFDYEKLKIAVNVALKSKHIVSCNTERTFPCGKTMVCPGCGAMVAAIEHCSGKKTDVVIGKPTSHMFNSVPNIHNYSPENVLIVGDTYESDIKMAENCGAHSVLIGTNHPNQLSIDSIKGLPNVLKTVYGII